MKKILLTIMALMILISLVQAEQETLGTFKQGDCIELLQLCGNCTWNNITSIRLPSSWNNTQLAMTQNGYDYNLSYCETNTIGRYIVNGIGDLDGTPTVWSYDFYIRARGDEMDKDLSDTGIFLAIAMLCSMFIYIRVNKFFGSMGIFVLGLGMLFLNPVNGWIGWVVGAGGFAMMITVLITPKKKKRFKY